LNLVTISISILLFIEISFILILRCIHCWKTGINTFGLCAAKRYKSELIQKKN